MIWQDWVIGSVQVIALLALIPSLPKDASKPELSTCVMTAGTLLVLAVCFFTLWLVFSAVITFLTFVAWTCMALDRWWHVRV
jgi:uncharacterized membrane protein